MNLLNSNEEDLSEKGLVDFLREGKLEKYYQGFLDNGYEFVDDLFGIKEEDLKQIEISEEDRPKLLDQTKRILPHRKKHEMPEDIEGWLKKHHLRDYNLKITGEFKHLWELRKLKTKPERELKEFAEKKFGIKEPGHFKRLLRAVYSLQVKEHVPMTVSNTEYILTSVRSVESDSHYYPKDEITFWEKLLEEGFLSPHNAASASTSSAEKDLQKLRITTFWVFGVSNFLWMILILTLVPRRDLKILGLDVIALSFLIIYGGIFVVQFLALLCHRVKTIMHILARTPWTVHKKSDSGKNEGKNGQSVLQQRKNRRVHPYFQA